MSELIEISRVVIIADTVLEKTLLDEIMRLGAKGYTYNYCTGKGRHETVEDPYTGRSRIRIEVLAERDVASAIFEYVHKKKFGPYAVAAYTDAVLADNRDHYY